MIYDTVIHVLLFNVKSYAFSFNILQPYQFLFGLSLNIWEISC